MAPYSKRDTLESFLRVLFMMNVVILVRIPLFGLGSVGIVATFPITIIVWLASNRPLSCTAPLTFFLTLAGFGRKHALRRSSTALKELARLLNALLAMHYITAFQAFVLGRRIKVVGARTMVQGDRTIETIGKARVVPGQETSMVFRWTGLFFYVTLLALDAALVVLAVV